jgi:DNA repair photolyase
MSARFGRDSKFDWTTPRLRKKAITKGYRKRAGTFMFPTTHDITETNLEHCLAVLKELLAAGNDVLVVSKPHLSCIEALCKELDRYKGQILYRFTIGSADDAVLSFWEPHAPSYRERIDSLRWAHDHGFKTSVSCEPMLDGNIQKVIDDARPYVTDAIWLGRVNKIKNSLALNAPGNKQAMAKADQLLAIQTDQWVMELYKTHKDDPLIKYKDSIKKVAGLDRPTEKGLDI